MGAKFVPITIPVNKQGMGVSRYPTTKREGDEKMKKTLSGIEYWAKETLETSHCVACFYNPDLKVWKHSTGVELVACMHNSVHTGCNFVRVSNEGKVCEYFRR
ncbi:MAG: hypothetical protein PHR47_02760 [Candidatus Pacebacteria bacterium]|nr:hypothetical protein [Candidatus Paceibacterota bacterium]